MDQDTSLRSSDPTTPSGNCPFVEIPLEILHRITKNLTTPDLGNVRLTCRSVERSLDHAFIHEFFTRKKFMFTKFSLETLRDISQSRLAPYLRQLEFGLEHFYPVQNHVPSHPALAKAVAKYKDVESENNLWVFSGRRHQTLMAALSGLENLKAIMIREINSRTRFRDGTDYQWNSYGLITLSKETGLSTSEICPLPRLGNEAANEIFICTMQVLAEAQITAVKGIEFVGFRNVSLVDQSFAIPPSIRAAMEPILKNLEKLHIVPKWDSGEFFDEERGDTHPKSHPNSHLMNFLSQTVNLQDLRINGLVQERGEPSTQVFLKWLTHSDRSKVLPKLQALSLGIGTFEQEALIDLIKRFSETIVSLQLWKINITTALIPELKAALSGHGLRTVRRNGQSLDNQELLGACGWTSFLSQCQEIEGLSLRHVKFGRLSQTFLDSANSEEQIPVKAPWKITFDGEPLIEYTGPDWKSFVGEKALNIED